jgi:hypothetical protein
VDVVRAEPYRLASEVWGIGLKTADTIAASVGIARDSPERIKAGLAYALSQAADNGHRYLPVPNLIADTAKILEVPAEMIGPCLDELAAAEGVVREELSPAAADASPVPAVCLPPIQLNGRWRLPSAACSPRGTNACPASPPWTGTRRCAGCASAPGPCSRPSRPTRCGSP